MADLATARRWATAFLDLAAENNRIDELGAELSAVREAFTGPGLYALSNPVFTLDERRAALDAILSKGSVGGLTANLLRLMLDKGRFAILGDVVDVYLANADERAGRLRVSTDVAPDRPRRSRLARGCVRADRDRVTRDPRSSLLLPRPPAARR